MGDHLRKQHPWRVQCWVAIYSAQNIPNQGELGDRTEADEIWELHVFEIHKASRPKVLQVAMLAWRGSPSVL